MPTAQKWRRSYQGPKTVTKTLRLISRKALAYGLARLRIEAQKANEPP